MKPTLLSAICVSAVILASCNQAATSDENPKEQVAHTDEVHATHAPNGDLQEETMSVDVLPSFLDGKSDELKLAYEAAGKLNDQLQYIPCYCGCGDSAGHESNANCFVKEIKEDGTVVWDDHGTRCDVCVQTVFTTAKNLQDGKSVKEIRQIVDEMYKTGYAKPTPTPMPL